MPISILHVSDLHRDPTNPITNEALLNSLENDRQRYSQQHPTVRSPDIIVVSGDVIQGVMPTTPDPETHLRRQYSEALAFLGQLAERFTGGDRNRVVIVPGNHDVSASHFMKSLQRVDIAPGRKKDLVTQLFSTDSPLRWSWSDFELYEISDPSMYARRFAAFSEFYAEFYGGSRTYDLHAQRQFDIFDFPDFNLAIVGFSSCFNNDIFNRRGAIHPVAIGEASLTLRAPAFQDRLRIAVWHHNTEGLPMQSDYMEPDILQNLIDSGFSLGLHGHQHRPQFLDTRFRYGGDRRITVISAGTLCGGASFRFGRAYNIIELDETTQTGRLHLREMQNDNLQLPIWGARAPAPNAPGDCLQFQYNAPPEPPVRTDRSTSLLIEAQRLYEQGEYRAAADALAPIADSNDLARRLLLGCFAQLADMPGIIACFDPPVSTEEAIYLVEALWIEGKRDRLKQLLTEPLVMSSTDPSIAELRTKYTARLSK